MTPNFKATFLLPRNRDGLSLLGKDLFEPLWSLRILVPEGGVVANDKLRLLSNDLKLQLAQFGLPLFSVAEQPPLCLKFVLFRNVQIVAGENVSASRCESPLYYLVTRGMPACPFQVDSVQKLE